MMDAKDMYPDGWHAQRPFMKRDFGGTVKHLTRTQRPVRYYLIDFGISRAYDGSDPSPKEEPIFGGDRTVPEFQGTLEPCDPFPTDVYYLGNLIREDFLGVSDSHITGYAWGLILGTGRQTGDEGKAWL